MAWKKLQILFGKQTKSKKVLRSWVGCEGEDPSLVPPKKKERKIYFT
jgi:hypothetical protein